ncbi:MAG: hypothetical protein OXH86_07480 [Acidimicrobiaceae bacterium]|nr:hypothetical protein [Acidimicrobiaceae bacterium]MDE0497178.1 hypothetical protein [Acidimicrobiaceae bacterium]
MLALAAEAVRLHPRSAEEALHNLDGVAADFIASYNEHGDELPESIAAAGELVVAV